MNALDVLCFGEALLDFFPEKPGVPLVACDVFHRHLGGAPCNVAVGLARNGARAGLMTLVGPDEFGTFVRARLAQEGIDVAGVGVHRTAKTGVTFVSVGAAGERSFLFFRHPSADQMITCDDVDEQVIARARVLHVGSSTMATEPSRAATLRAVELARAHGRWVSSDPNWRPHLWADPREAAPLVAQVLSRCEIVKVSDDELGPLVGTSDVEEGARRLRALGCGLAVITLGARGCHFSTAAASGHVAGERVTVVDTTGAGDAFTAGLLSVLAPKLEARGIAGISPELIGQLAGRGIAWAHWLLPRWAPPLACRRASLALSPTLMTPDEERDRLQQLHLVLEAALEQLGYAQQVAAKGGSIEAPSAEMQAIEKVFAEVNRLRNGVRDQLMKRLGRPRLDIVK